MSLVEEFPRATIIEDGNGIARDCLIETEDGEQVSIPIIGYTWEGDPSGPGVVTFRMHSGRCDMVRSE